MAKKETSQKTSAKSGAANAKAKKAAAGKAPAKPAAKPAVKPAPVKKAAPSKTAAKAAPASKAPAKKAAAPKAPAPKAPAKKAAAPVKAAAPKAGGAKTGAPKATGKAAPKAPAKKVAVSKAAPKPVVPKPSAKKTPAPKAAPKQVSPVRPQQTPVSERPKATPKVAAPKAAAKKEAPKAAGAKATKPLSEKKPVSQKTPMAAQATQGTWPQTVETDARKLAIQKIQAKRGMGGAEQRPAPNAGAGLEPSQPTGMYNGIVVTHEIKSFPAKTPYSQQELDELRETLIEEREKLLAQLASLHGVSMEALVSAKEGSNYSIHIAEHASDLQTAEANMGVRGIEEERLEQVESALDRIENNQRHYGLCMACGNKIGIQRLKAVPHAHLCMPCRKRYETVRSRRGY